MMGIKKRGLFDDLLKKLHELEEFEQNPDRLDRIRNAILFFQREPLLNELLWKMFP
jgi:hypothetical protein